MQGQFNWVGGSRARPAPAAGTITITSPADAASYEELASVPLGATVAGTTATAVDFVWTSSGMTDAEVALADAGLDGDWDATTTELPADGASNRSWTGYARATVPGGTITSDPVTITLTPYAQAPTVEIDLAVTEAAAGTDLVLEADITSGSDLFPVSEALIYSEDAPASGVYVLRQTVTNTGAANPWRVALSASVPIDNAWVGGTLSVRVVSHVAGGSDGTDTDGLAVEGSYALDRYASPAFGVALRRVKAVYSGGYYRVRRTNDNEETNVLIPASGAGVLSLSCVTTAAGDPTFGTWLGANTARVVTWFDQNGTSIDFSQSNAALQPRAANAGVIDVDAAGNPRIFFTSANLERLDYEGAPFSAFPFSVLSVGSRTNSHTGNIFAAIDKSVSNKFFLMQYNGTNFIARARNTTAVSTPNIATAQQTTLFLSGVWASATSRTATMNGTSQSDAGSVTANMFTITRATIGAFNPTAGASDYLNGGAQMVLGYSSDVDEAAAYAYLDGELTIP
jgi:hypothetical protein